MQKILNYLKKSGKTILLFTIITIGNVVFHFLLLFFGNINFLLVFSFFTIFAFSLSLFKKFYKKFLYFITFLVVVEILIVLIPFPECSFTFKGPKNDCKCIGIKKHMFGGTQCIGKRESCYQYFENPNFSGETLWDLYDENPYHSKLEVECKK